jgi:peptidyl-tRNA hydrolase, PTH1 family
VGFWQRLLGRAPTGASEDGTPLKVIVGLGNPGLEYAKTRHNVGWWVVDHLADVWRFDDWRKDGLSQTASGSLGGARIRLVKPQTFMNRSGQALRPFLRREGFSVANDLLVVVDEVAIPTGTWRFRARGSAGGHNGLKDVERAVETQEYARLRVGVGPVGTGRRIGDLSDYVLDRMGKAEMEIVAGLMKEMEEVVEAWIREGVKGAGDVQSRSGER